MTKSNKKPENGIENTVAYAEKDQQKKSIKKLMLTYTLPLIWFRINILKSL